jgi:hypothetical protein
MRPHARRSCSLRTESPGMKMSRSLSAALAAIALVSVAGCHTPYGGCHGGRAGLAMQFPCASSVPWRLLGPRHDGLWTDYCLDPFVHGRSHVSLAAGPALPYEHAPGSYSFPAPQPLLPLLQDGAAIKGAPPVQSEEEDFSAPSPPPPPTAPKNDVPAAPEEPTAPVTPDVDSSVEEPTAPPRAAGSSRRPKSAPPAPSFRTPAPVETAPEPDQIPSPPTPPRNELPLLEPADSDAKADSASLLRFFDQRKSKTR